MTLTCYAVMLLPFLLIVTHDYGIFVGAANVTQANSTNSITISRHMTLARVFSAVYLQVQLTNKKMNRKDVLANVWNLENKQDLDKLVSLKFEGASQELTLFSASISEAPHANETEMIEFRADYENFLGFKGQKRQNLSTVVKLDQFPLLPPKISLVPSPNLTEQILAKIELFQSVGPTDLTLAALKEYLRKYVDVFAHEYNTGFIEETVHALIPLYDKLSAAMAFFDLQDSLTRIQKMLPKLEKIVNHQKSFSAVSITTNTIHLLEELCSVFSIFDKPLTSFPIGHALHRRLNLAQIQQDIKNKWVEGVLNKKEMLQKLSDYYTNGKSALNPIELITMDSDILFDRNNYNMIRYFVKTFKTIQSSKSINNIDNMANRDCLTLFDKNVSRQDIEKLLKIPPIYKRIKEALLKYNSARRSIPNVTSLVQEIEEINRQFPSSIVFTAQDWNWKRNLKQFVSDHRGDYERIEPREDISRDVMAVGDRERNNTNQLLRDVLNKIAQLKIGEQRCDSMFTLDLSEIGYSINFAKIINNIKSEGATKKVINFVAAVEKMQKGLNELGEESEIETKKASKRNINDVVLKEYSDYPSLLLNYSEAAYSLEELNKLYDQLSLLIRKGDYVVGVIRRMNDSEDKTELDNAWSNFITLKTKLVEFQANSTKILEIVNLPKFSQPERTLQEVGLMYKEISTILIAGSFDLRKMRESMILLNPRIPDVESALVYLETPLAMNWNSAQGSFESVPDVLAALQIMPPLEPKTMTKYIIIGIAVILGIIVVAIIVVIVLVCCWMNRQDPDLELEPPPEKAYEAPPDEFIKFTYMQLQDCRLKINSRDPITGNTSLFDAVERRDYDKVRELVEEGVVLDAVCGGESLRTAIFQLEFQKNKEMCALLLKNGADQLLVDAAGEDCDTWADYNGVDHIFKKYYELNRNLSTKPRRIIPKNTPRTWNVLVLDDCKFKGYKRRKLPLRIKKRIAWGYGKEKDLDEFTHIVLPSKYVCDKNALKLDDEDLMTYKLYACKAVLMNKDWLEALVKMKDKAMDEDYNWYVLNTRYNGETHRDTIYNIKTNHYRMVPRLLKNADICILPSTSTNFEKNRNEWKKIIEMLGGTYVKMTDIKPDGPKTNTPYWTRTEAYKGEMHEFSQNRCWILKTKGCQINSEWRKDHGMYTLADFKFLTESIARNSILRKDNDVVPLDYEGNSLKAKSKGTSSTAKSSTAISSSKHESSSKSPHTKSKTPVKSQMEAMKYTEMEKRQQEMRKEIKKASSN